MWVACSAGVFLDAKVGNRLGTAPQGVLARCITLPGVCSPLPLPNITAAG